MFGMKFYSNEESKEDSSDMFIINGENKSITEDDIGNVDLKQEYFNKWKDSINEINEIVEGSEKCQYSGNENGKQYDWNADKFVTNEEDENTNEEDENTNEDDENTNEDDEQINEEDEQIKENDEKINEDDEDEYSVDKLYIISLDGVPYYYENDLISARSKMWDIANNILKKDSEKDFENPNYIFTNNLNKVSLISPYNFFGLNYHHTICELQIDYVVRYKK